MSIWYIIFVQKQSITNIVHYLRKHARQMILLTVPAAAYNLQSSLEYVALAHLNAAVFSVIVQTKLIFTAIFARLVLGKRLRKQQVISLTLLTIGVMMCNMRSSGKGASLTAAAATAATVDDEDPSTMSMLLLINQEEATHEVYTRQIKGILVTLGIAITSGFASVYTEKFIKGTAQTSSSPSSATTTTTTTTTAAAASSSTGTCNDKELEEAIQTEAVDVAVAADDKNEDSSYGLAYTQVQLAVMSILTIGLYALIMDGQLIVTSGLFINFSTGAVVSVCMSAVDGLIVASVLKYAD